MTFNSDDYRFMRRALELAAHGYGHVSPNPMVGAVIVGPHGRIIGEGWHRRFGEGHAEVNAVASVSNADRPLLSQSTIYVTLEPCSHYGKTPPCAKLLSECQFKRVVVGAGDPNPKVSGRGIAMLRDAGVEVDEGLLADESIALNKTFMTSQRLRRPFVTLKWAQSADGFMDCRRSEGEPAARFSTLLSSQIVHQRRATHDGIAIGARTAIADNPSLNVRLIAGNSPKAVIFDRHNLVNEDNCRILSRAIHLTEKCELCESLEILYNEHGITSLLVEGGAGLLREFIATGLWEEAYVEIAPFELDARGCTQAPILSDAEIVETQEATDSENRVNFYSHIDVKRVKNI